MTKIRITMSEEHYKALHKLLTHDFYNCEKITCACNSEESYHVLNMGTRDKNKGGIKIERIEE